MLSPHQFRAASTPKKVTPAGGIKMSTPMASGRATPTKKTAAKLCNDCCKPGVAYG